MAWLSKKFILLWGQEITPGKVIVTIHGLSVHDLRQGDIEVHGKVLTLFVHRQHNHPS